MRPTATLSAMGPDALLGLGLARTQPARNALGNKSDWLKVFSPGEGLLHPIHLRRNLVRSRPDPFLSGEKANHLRHPGLLVSGSTLGGIEHDMEMFCGSRKSVRERENSSEREKDRE